MGFYGNITNTSKTQFQFDRIYPNRKMMDENAGTDGIYMGRYVLIEYDINDEKYLDNYPRLFKYDDKYYYVADMQNNLDSRIEVKYGEKNVEKGRFFRVTEKLDLDPSNGVDNSIYVLYKCTGSKENNIATFSYVSGIEETNDYARNYNIDIDEYGPSRGWDSTVWQKVFVGGDTKYVMIAELNTVVPTFGITVDAPTMNPIVPHFDQESNNIYYKLHLQPSWGMRVKEGEANKSDEEVIWKSISYDPVTDKETAVEETKKGAIYYNKAGFSKENIVYSPAGTKDKVTIEPTGKSGTEYNVHNESAAPQTKKVPDIQEVSIILPSIGDSIAEMWDLVYGNSSQNNGTKRNTDVDWDSTDGLRMINVSEDGNGWTYDPDKVETLAGGINAIHDLMGMIIVDKDNLSETDIDELNLDGIYYDKTTGTYNRKAKYYEYTAIENKSIDPYEAKNVTLTEDTYKPNIYYLNQDLTEKDNGVVFDNTKTYYEKHLNAQPMGTKVEGLIDWAANTYFYKNVAGNIYTLDKSESPDDDKVYYNIDKIKVDLPVTYEKGKYWYKQKRDSVDGECYDYFRENLDIPQSDKNIKYYTPTFTEVKDNLLPYRENTYATLVTVPNSSPEVKIYVIDKDGFNADVEYYALSSYTIVTEEIDIVIKGEDGTEMPGKQTIEKIKYDKEPEKIKLFDPSEKKYYYKLNEDTYKIFDNYNDLPANTTKFYTIEEGSQIEEFYISEKYYYQKYPGVFVLDEEKVKVNGRIYYKIENEKRVSNFYRPDTYYYKRALDGEYVLDTNEKMTLNREYYLGEEFYVYEDTLEVFDKYSLWNNNVTTVPHTVTLARREAKWGYKELVGFARSMNTIHGLILEINKIMEFENETTRDLNTVQGCINKLKDIIFKFDQLVPGTFVIVDSYGRAHSADYTTKQSYSAINKNTGNIISTIDETEDRWIDLDINDNAKESTIYIRHNYTSTENSNSFVDKNNEETDIIKTYYPIVDNTGHIVGDHYETITLPYGFKTITTNGRGTGTAENATETPEKTNVVAENIQDTLAINSGNRWIRIDTNSSDDSLTFSHDIHNTSSTTSFQDLSDEESAKVNFDIPTYFFDEAGHYTSHDLKVLEMPFGYGKIIGDSGSTAATATFDTITFGSDDWLTATVSKDKVVYSHDYPAMKNDTTSTSDVNGNRDTIVLETLTHDEKGHVINVNKETVTLPYGYKTFKDSNPTVGNSVASNTQDTFVFKGDSWINPTVSNDLLTLTHTGPIGTAPAAKNAVEPKFGNTFDIEDWYFDDKGHKYAGGTHTVKIPRPSLETLGERDEGESWVLTKLELDNTEGKLTQTINKIGSLTLSGYQQPEGGDFGPEDTLNTALNTLQVQTISLQDQISQEKINRENAISTITGNSVETIASLLRKINALQDSYDALLARVKDLEAYHSEENA